MFELILYISICSAGSQGSRGAQGRCFSNLGFALVELGELEEAWESYTHAQQAFRDTGTHNKHTHSLTHTHTYTH